MNLLIIQYFFSHIYYLHQKSDFLVYLFFIFFSYLFIVI